MVQWFDLLHDVTLPFPQLCFCGELFPLPMLYLTISVATDEPRSLMGMMFSPSITCSTGRQEAIGILHKKKCIILIHGCTDEILSHHSNHYSGSSNKEHLSMKDISTRPNSYVLYQYIHFNLQIEETSL